MACCGTVEKSQRSTKFNLILPVRVILVDDGRPIEIYAKNVTSRYIPVHHHLYDAWHLWHPQGYDTRKKHFCTANFVYSTQHVWYNSIIIIIILLKLSDLVYLKSLWYSKKKVLIYTSGWLPLLETWNPQQP